MLNLPPYPQNPQQNDWSGHTLEEIRMRRVLVQARMEIEKYKLEKAFNNAKSNTIFGGSGSAVSRIANTFSWMEYGFFIMKAIRTIRSVFRKKKN